MFYVFVLCCNSLYPLDIIYLMVLHFYAILIEIHSKICNAFEKGVVLVVLWAGPLTIDLETRPIPFSNELN